MYAIPWLRSPSFGSEVPETICGGSPPTRDRWQDFNSGGLSAALRPNDWKPLPSVGLGVREVRLHTGVEHRVVYLAKFEEAVYVLHAFEKRSQRTPKRELELARHRLRTLLKQRPRGGR